MGFEQMGSAEFFMVCIRVLGFNPEKYSFVDPPPGRVKNSSLPLPTYVSGRGDGCAGRGVGWGGLT